MRLVALTLLPHRLGFPLPGGVLRRWIRLWDSGSVWSPGAAASRVADAAFHALAAPWWLDAACAGPSAPDKEQPGGPVPPWPSDAQREWKLAPFSLPERDFRLLRAQWREAVTACRLGYELAQRAGIARPWQVGQLAALSAVLATARSRPSSTKGSRPGRWLPASSQRLRRAFPWLEAVEQHLQAAFDHWLRLLGPAEAPRGGNPATSVVLEAIKKLPAEATPEDWSDAGRCFGTLFDSAEPTSLPASLALETELPVPFTAEQLHWAALARGIANRQLAVPPGLQDTVAHATAQAAASAARLSPPGKNLRHLALAWEHQRRQNARWRRRFQQRLFQAKQRALAHWAAGAGHMVNNPLAVIAGRAQLALRQTDSPALRRHLHLIQAQAKRAHRMIAGLALYAQPVPPQREWIPAAELLEPLRQQFAELAQSRNVELQFHTEPELAACVDWHQVALAVQALVENALAAVDEGGQVQVRACGRAIPRGEWASPGTVFYGPGFEPLKEHLPVRDFRNRVLHSAWATGSRQPTMDAPGSGMAAAETDALAEDEPPLWLELAVEDTGPGVSLEAAPWIFDPFYSGLEAGRGMGLGLCFLWRIVQQHGGWLQVDRGPSRFTLWLPEARRPSHLSGKRHDAPHAAVPRPHPPTVRHGSAPSAAGD